MKILSFGEIIWDVYPDRSALGGAPLNLAVHCAALGAEASMISAVGNDPLGAEALEAIAARGVSSEFISVIHRQTGMCRVTLDESKVPSYDLLRDTAYDFISLSHEDTKHISLVGFDALCFGTLIQRSGVSRSSLKRLIKEVPFATVFCDVNLRKGNYDEDSARLCLENAHLLKVSLEEAPELTALGIYSSPADGSPLSLANTLFSAFPRLASIALTDGAKGAYSVNRGGSVIFCPAKQVEVVSTVGAGDSFGAAWLISLLSGDTPKIALEKAVAYSALVISGKA